MCDCQCGPHKNTVLQRRGCCPAHNGVLPTPEEPAPAAQTEMASSAWARSNLSDREGGVNGVRQRERERLGVTRELWEYFNMHSVNWFKGGMEVGDKELKAHWLGPSFFSRGRGREGETERERESVRGRYNSC